MPIPKSIPAASTLQAGGGTLTGNGTSLDLGGAHRAVLFIATTTGTAGIFTFEHSFDGGQVWSQCNEVRDAAAADSAAAITATAAGQADKLLKVDPHNGPCLLRARISTAWVTSAPAVTGFPIR